MSTFTIYGGGRLAAPHHDWTHPTKISKMEKNQKPILALLSAALFWLLAIASSPQIGQNVTVTAAAPEPRRIH